MAFTLGDYDANLPLVIDPVLGYFTYLGGSSEEEGSDIAVDESGNMVVLGRTYSDDFSQVKDSAEINS